MGRGTARGRGKGKGAREAPRSRSAGREASSGEGVLLTRCADTDTEEIWCADTEDAEAATGRKTAKGRPARKLSKKLIGAAGSLGEGRKVAAAAAAKGAAEGDKHSADVTQPADADDANPKKGGLRLSDECVQLFLSLEPVALVDPDEEYARMTSHPGIYSQEFIDETVEIFRDIAEMKKSIYGDLQAWMRAELDDKGYVELDAHQSAEEEEAEEEAQTELWVNAFGPRETLNA